MRSRISPRVTGKSTSLMRGLSVSNARISTSSSNQGMKFKPGAMDKKVVHKSLHMGVSVISFQDGPTLNALSPSLLNRIYEAVSSDDQCNVVFIKPIVDQNKKIFSSGGNLKG